MSGKCGSEQGSAGKASKQHRNIFPEAAKSTLEDIAGHAPELCLEWQHVSGAMKCSLPGHPAGNELLVLWQVS